MTGMLASVANLAEARLVLEAGVDIVDLKNPEAGALGALSLDDIRDILGALGGSKPISATIGDLPMIPEQVQDAVLATASTGVDYVKLGFFPGGDWPGVIDALAEPARSGIRLIAVLFGDQGLNAAPLDRLAAAGFAGAMIDTMDKTRGPLTRLCTLDELAQWVAQARQHELLCGLAGSLHEDDIKPLSALRPDYLGFRGALCRQHSRIAALDPVRVQNIREQVGVRNHLAHTASPSAKA